MIADISMGRQGMEITVGLKRAPQRDFFVVVFCLSSGKLCE